MATARDLINASLRKILAVSSGETIQAAEINDGLSELNRMLSNWSTEKLTIPHIVREEFTLTQGQGAYTFGTGANFDSARPAFIEHAMSVIYNNEPYETPVRMLNHQEWAAITDKLFQSDIPTDIYIQNTYPNLTIQVYPVPSSNSKLVLYTKKPLLNIANASTELNLSEGYEDAIVYNLALRMAPEYGRPVSQEVYKFASESKSNIKRKNIETELMSPDIAVLSRNTFNIYTGESR